jgi:hypothetical protein
MTSVIQEYMVRLGFDVANPEFEKLNGVLRDADMAVNRFATGALKHVVEAQVGIVGAFVSMSGAVVGLVDKVAMADLGYSKMAVRMMMTKDSVRTLDIVTKALGASLEEIWWNPELRERAGELMAHLSKLNQALGPDFEKNMKGVRDIRQQFSLFKVDLQFLGMTFASDIFKKLFPNDDALNKMKGFIDKFEAGIPGFADKLATYAVPILKDTWSIMKGLGEAIKTGALAFTNLVGVFSGDSSIEGTAFSLDKMAKAFEHIVGWMKTLVDWITKAESMLAHFAVGTSLLLSGKWKDAGAEFMAGISQVSAGPGALIGGTIGMMVGGPLGAAKGAVIGAGAGSAVTLTQDQAARAATVGGLKGVGIGAIGSVGEWLAAHTKSGAFMHRWGEELSGESQKLWNNAINTSAQAASLSSRLLGAISGVEAGHDPNALSIRNKNAGNLMTGGKLNVYGTKEEGDQSALDQINRNIDRGLTLNEFFGGNGTYPGWSPKDDGVTPALKGNNPAAYAARVAKQLGIDPNVPLKQIANPTIPQMGASLRGGGSKTEINGISIYIMQPNATPTEIQVAIANGVDRAIDRRNQLGMSQVAPAWG